MHVQSSWWGLGLICGWTHAGVGGGAGCTAHGAVIGAVWGRALVGLTRVHPASNA